MTYVWMLSYVAQCCHNCSKYTLRPNRHLRCKDIRRHVATERYSGWGRTGKNWPNVSRTAAENARRRSALGSWRGGGDPQRS
jgi:hypothetical protein